MCNQGTDQVVKLLVPSDDCHKTELHPIRALFITFIETVMRFAKSSFDCGVTIDGQKIADLWLMMR